MNSTEECKSENKGSAEVSDELPPAYFNPTTSYRVWLSVPESQRPHDFAIIVATSDRQKAVDFARSNYPDFTINRATYVR